VLRAQEEEKRGPVSLSEVKEVVAGSRSMDVVPLCYEIICNKGKVPDEVGKIFGFCKSAGSKQK
jgi:hypothetical protein